MICIGPAFRRNLAWAVQKSLYFEEQRAAIPQFALPNDQRRPAQFREGFKVLSVAELVSQELRQPEILIRPRYEPGLAAVRMPKTSMDEYDFAAGGENKVRLARKVCPVETEPVAETMHKAPHRHFGHRVLAADCAHVLAAIHTSSYLEFLTQPIQDGPLLFLTCPPNLG